MCKENERVTEETPSLWRLDYTLTGEEIAHGLRMTDPRQKSRARTAIFSVMLGAGFVYFFIGYVTGDLTNTTQLALAIASGFFLAMVLLAPRLQANAIARKAGKRQKPVTVRGYENALGFGTGEAFQACAWNEFSMVYDDTMCALTFADGQLLLIPRRATDEATWAWLCAAKERGV